MKLTDYIKNEKLGFDILELVDGSIVDAVEYEHKNRKILIVQSKLYLSDNSTTISGITTSANLFESGLHNFGRGFPEIMINKLCIWHFCRTNNLKIVHVINSFPEEQIFVESGQNEIETEEELEKYFRNIKSIFINRPQV